MVLILLGTAPTFAQAIQPTEAILLASELDSITTHNQFGERPLLGIRGPIQAVFNPGDGLAVGDVNGDGTDEIVVAHAQDMPGVDPSRGSVNIFNFFGVSLGGFTYSSANPVLFGVGDGLAVGDVNGDGTDDIVIANAQDPPGSSSARGSISIYNSSGASLGGFSHSPSAPVLFGVGDGLAVGDVVGGTTEEIIIAHALDMPGVVPSRGSVAIYSHTGASLGGFMHSPINSVNFGVGTFFWLGAGDGLAVGDLDGNGTNEIVIANALDPVGAVPPRGGVAIYSATGTRVGGFSHSPIYSLFFAHGDGLAVGDVNADGIDEIVIAHAQDMPGTVPSRGSVAIYDQTGAKLGGFAHSPFKRVHFGIGEGFAVGGEIGDRDQDGLLDPWEQNPIDYNSDGTDDLDLPALGADPLHKDLFVEIDAFDCTAAGGDCVAGDTHTHVPIAAATMRVVNAFAVAPVQNPDGLTGIDLHLQVDETLPHRANCEWDCFDGIKASNFGTAAEQNNPNALRAKSMVYHYSLWVHNRTASNSSSGVAEVFGNDFIVSLGSFAGDVGNINNQAGTLMHEFGHNLGFWHGGGDKINCKPNYLSVMSYAFQMSGLMPGNIFDYSRSVIPAASQGSLNESNLVEFVGIQDGGFNTFYGPPTGATPTFLTGAGMGGINWDNDTIPNETSVQADINNLGINKCGASPGQNLEGFDDWSNLQYNFRLSSDFEAGSHATAANLVELDLLTAQDIEKRMPPSRLVPGWRQRPRANGEGFNASSNLDWASPVVSISTGNLDFDDLSPADITGKTFDASIEFAGPVQRAMTATVTAGPNQVAISDVAAPLAKGCSDVHGFQGNVVELIQDQSQPGTSSLELEFQALADAGARVVSVSAFVRNCGGQAAFEITEVSTPAAPKSKAIEPTPFPQAVAWQGSDIKTARFEGQELAVDQIRITARFEEVESGPKTIIADDFESDGRPIKEIGFWGSYLDAEFLPSAFGGSDGDGKDVDGWLLSFHSDQPVVPLISGDFSRPNTLLGLYYCPATVVDVKDTGLHGCEPDPHRVYEYRTELENCWPLDVGRKDPRDLGDLSARPPALANTFLGVQPRIYWVGIQAVAGYQVDPTTGNSTLTNNSAATDFWGWHTVKPSNIDESVAGLARPPSREEAGQEWSYGDWRLMENQVCSKGDQAFEFLVATVESGSNEVVAEPLPLWLPTILALLLLSGLVVASLLKYRSDS